MSGGHAMQDQKSAEHGHPTAAVYLRHLKMDSPFFTFLFGGPLLLATAVILALMFLFGAFTLRR